MQLRFTSLTVTSSREDLHLQECAHAGRTNTVVADKVCGLYVANAITTALFARERTGRGQQVEVPMFECMVAFLLPEHLGGLTFEPPQGEAGYSRLLNEFRRPQRSRDGFIAIVPYTDAQWVRFFALCGRDDLAADPRFTDNVSRSRHIRVLYETLADLVAERTNAEWMALLDAADLPYAPVQTIDELTRDPHLQQSGFWHLVEHPTEGRLRMPGIPVRFSDTPGSIRRLAPNLGEHSAQVLSHGWGG